MVVGMILILIFAEALGLFGFIVAIVVVAELYAFADQFLRQAQIIHPPRLTTMATIKPKSPRASAKIRMRIIPTTMSFWAFARTAASPTTPMARPEAREERPQQSPAPSC